MDLALDLGVIVQSVIAGALLWFVKGNREQVKQTSDLVAEMKLNNYRVGKLEEITKNCPLSAHINAR
jgi:hypothetical protein